MKVSEKEVVYVADLANLELTDAERAALSRDLNSILEFIDQLDAVDVSGIQPFASGAEPGAAGGGTELFPGARADVVAGSLEHAAALENAAEADSKFFKVPRVL